MIKVNESRRKSSSPSANGEDSRFIASGSPGLRHGENYYPSTIRDIENNDLNLGNSSLGGTLGRGRSNEEN